MTINIPYDNLLAIANSGLNPYQLSKNVIIRRKSHGYENH
jgi:hypothetical protein